MNADQGSGFLNYINLILIVGIIISLSYLISLERISKEPHVYIITAIESSNNLDHLLEVGRVVKNLDNITWLVVEKSNELSLQIENMLMEMNVPFEHLLGKQKIY